MRSSIPPALMLLLILLGSSEAHSTAPGVKIIVHTQVRVIVHASNSVFRLTKKQVSDIFLKKSVRWPDKNSITPYDLKYDSSARSIFSKTIHGRSPVFIKNYWQQKVFGGYELPPLELSEQQVIEMVGREPGSIGYVSVNLSLPPTVKEVEVLEP